MARLADRRLRLRDVEPGAVALEAAQGLLDDVRQKLRLLSPAHELQSDKRASQRLSETQVYRTVYKLAEYAKTGVSADDQPLLLLRDLAPLASAALHAVDALEVTPEPDTALGVVIAGAVARSALARSLPLTAPQLAVLVGFDRDHITYLAAQGEIPGAYRSGVSLRAPWLFRNSKALRAWIEEKEADDA